MTETSFPWNGTATGDASLAPYTSKVFHETFWKVLHTRSGTEQGIIYYSNGLIVTGVTLGVQVAAGAALVDGRFYINDDIVNVSIPTPTTNPRIDVIQLLENETAQTVRIDRVVGTEAATPSVPTYTGVPLAQVYVDTSGNIDVLDMRPFCYTPLVPQNGMTKLAEVTPSADWDELDFSGISQNFTHLMFVIRHSMSEAKTSGPLSYLKINNLPVTHAQTLDPGVAPLYLPVGSLQTYKIELRVAPDAAPAGVESPQDGATDVIWIHNYTSTAFYKTITHTWGTGRGTTISSVIGGLNFGLAEIFASVERLTFVNARTTKETSEQIFSLYGYL